ncbi:MAG TPA: 30S ribosomal protein S3 [Nitrososphaerales archaeon]|nr:30S ribosomal protein S3 [Nitrososphaerales archaeon]
MSARQQSSVKAILLTSRSFAELDEFFEKQLVEAGYGGLEVQKSPVGTTLKVYVARPGLAIGRRGTGIKELTDKVAAKFNFPNPQIAVTEVENPELNARIMAGRIAQIVSRGTAFRRAAMWSVNNIMNAGASGVEISVAGKLRSDRSHGEKYRAGVVPKSGDTADRAVDEATTDVLLKLGLYGIKVKIALKDALPPEFQFKEDVKQEEKKEEAQSAPAQTEGPQKPGR